MMCYNCTTGWVMVFLQKIHNELLAVQIRSHIESKCMYGTEKRQIFDISGVGFVMSPQRRQRAWSFVCGKKRNAVSGFLCTSALLRCKLENLKGPFLGSGGLSFYFFLGGHPPPPPPQEMVIGGPHLRKKGAWEMYTHRRENGGNEGEVRRSEMDLWRSQKKSSSGIYLKK